MIVPECRFDPVRDLTPVSPYPSLDLKAALANSTVPTVLPGAESDYNGVQAPEEIIGTPRDIFEAIDMQRAIESAAADQAESSSDGKSE